MTTFRCRQPLGREFGVRKVHACVNGRPSIRSALGGRDLFRAILTNVQALMDVVKWLLEDDASGVA
jgi:hypothetical protein